MFLDNLGVRLCGTDLQVDYVDPLLLVFFLFGVVVCCLCEVNGGGDCVTLGGVVN